MTIFKKAAAKQSPEEYRDNRIYDLTNRLYTIESFLSYEFQNAEREAQWMFTRRAMAKVKGVELRSPFATLDHRMVQHRELARDLFDLIDTPDKDFRAFYKREYAELLERVDALRSKLGLSYE